MKRHICVSVLLLLLAISAVGQISPTGYGFGPFVPGKPIAQSPSCTPLLGTVPVTVTCTNPNSGTTIVCTAASPTMPASNGLGTACSSGTQYTGPFTVSNAESLNYIAGAAGDTDSPVNFNTYGQSGVATSPSCSPTSGNVPVTLTCTNPNTTTPTIICYATAPTTPVSNGSGTACTTGSQYLGSFTITVAGTYNFIAGVNGETDSPVVNYTYGSSSSCGVAFTANGTGSGTMSDNQSPQQINFSYNGSSTTGTTSGNYACGTTVIFTPTETGSPASTFSWGTNTLGCGGGGTCTTTLTSTSGYTAIAHWTSGSTPTGTVSSTSEGLGINSGFPTVTFGYMRDWDTSGAEWAFWGTCSASSCTANDSNITYNFTTGGGSTSNSFDTWSADAYAAGVKDTQITLASRVPWYATSNPADTSCSYSCASGTNNSNGTCQAQGGAPQYGKSMGQCDPPTDLNTNGTGTNAYLRYNVKNVGQHVTNTTWLTSHAPVDYLEPLNEADTTSFFTGTYDQGIRDVWDIAQEYVGDANWNLTLTATSKSGSNVTYTVSNWGTGNPTGATSTFNTNGYYAGQYVNITGFSSSGNNVNGVQIASSTSTSFTVVNSSGVTCASSCGSGNALIVNPYTKETATQVQSSVGLTQSINAGCTSSNCKKAQVMTWSSHPQGCASLVKFQCAMYCKIPASSVCPGSCSSSCTSPGMSFPAQIINIHDKPGNDDPTTSENDLDNNVIPNLQGTLDPQDYAKVLFGPEAAYQSKGWANGGCSSPPASCGPPYDNYTDAGMEASFILRLYIYYQAGGISPSTNFSSTTWYNWKGTLGSTLANNAYTASYNYLVGSTIPVCSRANQTGSSGNFTYTYTCTYTDSSNTASAFIWDNSQYCTGNSTSATAASCSSVTRTVGSSYTHWTPLVNITIGSSTYCTVSGAGCTTAGPVAIVSHQVPVTIIPVRLQ